MPDEPIPAATLVIFREQPAGPPELLMVERAKAMVFAGGALVFPGGRIDPDDELLAERIGGDLADAAARIAAIRETIEETGLGPALAPAPLAAALAQLRQELEEGAPFSALLDNQGLTLELDALTPFARWCPTFKEARRFDTLFYLAEAPADAELPHAAEAEAIRTLWASAAEVLEQAESGRARIIFPTRRNLERLAQFGSFEAAVAHALAHPVVPITPYPEERADGPWLCIPEGLGYPVTAERWTSVMRG